MQRWYRYEFTFGVAQCSQFATEHTPGIYVDRAVQPFGLCNGRMPVNDHGCAAIFGSPVVTHGESIIVRLSRCLAVKSKIAYLARSTPLHFLLHARVCDHKLAVVEHVVADHVVEKLDDSLLELGAFFVEL